jgi:tripartite-type tricarboxylate transporter receptor subunit TctC
MSRASAALLATALVAASGLCAARADEVADFYANKKMDFIIGSQAGSGVDVWARLIGRHMSNHIPGRPPIIYRNMPGAGHIVATNYLYNQSPRDGTALGAVSRNLPTQELVGNPAIHFKMADFNWLGSPQSSHRVCIARAGVKVQAAQDLLKEPLIVAAAGGAISTTPVLLRDLLGMRFKVVAGYPSAAAAFLAIDRKEVEGLCQNLGGTEAVRPGWIAQGKLKVLFNLERSPIKGVAGISAPSIYQFTHTEEQRQIIAFFNSSVELGWPVMTTPGVPRARVAALRQAFEATMRDPEFLREAAALKFDIEPTSGEELADIIANLAKTPRPVIEKTAAIIGQIGN